MTNPGDPLGAIDYGRGVGHGADRGEASSSGGGGAGGDGLFVALTGLAQVYVEVDEAGSNDEAAGVKFLLGAAADLVGRGDFGDAAVVQQDIHGGVDLRGGVDEVAAFDK